MKRTRESASDVSLNELLELGEDFYDLTVKAADGSPVRCHRVVLALRCVHLRGQLQGSLKEIKLEMVPDGETLEWIINYLYGKEAPLLGDGDGSGVRGAGRLGSDAGLSSRKIWQVAESLQLESLKSTCEEACQKRARSTRPDKVLDALKNFWHGRPGGNHLDKLEEEALEQVLQTHLEQVVRLPAFFELNLTELKKLVDAVQRGENDKRAHASLVEAMLKWCDRRTHRLSDAQWAPKILLDLFVRAHVE